jgi:hypothetical protein
MTLASPATVFGVVFPADLITASPPPSCCSAAFDPECRLGQGPPPAEPSLEDRVQGPRAFVGEGVQVIGGYEHDHVDDAGADTVAPLP